MSQSANTHSFAAIDRPRGLVTGQTSRPASRFEGRLAARYRPANDPGPGVTPTATAAGRGSAHEWPSSATHPDAQPRPAHLGVEARDLTILFADIRGFSGMSEALKDNPVRLARLTEAVLGAMAEAVVGFGGTIDKFVGDSIMAFWGAPLAGPHHASRAVAAAEAMLAAVERLNDRLDLSLPDGGALAPIRIAVGVNSGTCAVGFVGSACRRDYTVLGDPVNVAARLVGLTKAYGLQLLIGEATAALLPTGWRPREVDQVAPRGRTGRQSLFALPPFGGPASSPNRPALH